MAKENWLRVKSCRKMVSEFAEEYGEEHEYTLYWLHSLSIFLLEQGKYMEAQAVLRKVWEIRKRTLGENHRGDQPVCFQKDTVHIELGSRV